MINSSADIDSLFASLHLPASNESIDIPVLETIYTCQQRHGLRHSDYLRYRRYCTKKIAKLRRSGKYQFVNKSKKFIKSKIPDKVTDYRIPLVYLYSAERCWAKAMDLKYSPEADEQEISLYDIRRKLRKAVQFAADLVKITFSNDFTLKTKLECEAYYRWLNGLYFFESSLWSDALSNLQFSKQIFEKFSTLSSSNQKEIFTKKIEDFSANIRYCQYQLKEMNVQELQQLNIISIFDNDKQNMIESNLLDTFKGITGSSVELQWIGVDVLLQNVLVLDAFYTANKFEEDIAIQDSIDLKVFDPVIRKLNRAIQKLQEDLRIDQNYQLFNRNEASSSALSSNMKVYCYLEYRRLLLRIEKYINHKRLLYTDKILDSTKAAKLITRYSQELHRLIVFIRPSDDFKKYKIASSYLNEFCLTCRYLILSRTLDISKYQKEIACLLLTCEDVILKLNSDNVIHMLKILLPRCDWTDIFKQMIKLSHHENIKFRMDSITLPFNIKDCQELSDFYSAKKPGTIPLMPQPVFVDIAKSELEIPELPKKEPKSEGLLSGFVRRFWS